MAITDRAQIALNHLKSGDFRLAGVIAEDLLQHHPDHQAGYRIMAGIANLRGNQSEAIRWIDQAMAKNPRNGTFRVNKARFMYAAGHVAAALEVLDTIANDGPLAPQANWLRMQCLEQVGEVDKALQLLETSTMTPRPPRLEAFQSRLEARMGKLEAARTRLEDLLSEPKIGPAFRVDTLFQLSRLNDRMGDYDAAFEAATEANLASQRTFDSAAYVAETDATIDYFTPERFELLPRGEATSELPVYIIGLPRSGTSLVEQIIDTHPRAAGSGERRDPIIIAEDLAHTLKRPFPHCLDDVTAATLTAAGAYYTRMLGSYGFGASRVTNKALGLDRVAGLLPLLTPGCRVVFVHRQPLDNLLSIFLHPLRTDRFPWAQSLDDLCVVQKEFDRLCKHWTHVLPCPCFDLSYESLVQDQRGVTESLLTFLDLPWDDACMDFHLSDRAVMTPTYDQVTETMNTKAVNRWKNYSTHIAPLINAFPAEAKGSP